MSTQKQPPPKALRIGIFQGERSIEERLVRKRGALTVGQKLANTFVVPASSMPESFRLFDVDAKGNYILRVSDRMGGRISLGSSEVIDLTRLRNVKQAKRVSDGYEITLNERSRGKVTVGDIRILFQFVNAPVAGGRMLPAAMGGGAIAGISTFVGAWLLMTLTLSAILQLGPLGYVLFQEWPVPEELEELPDWVLDAEAIEQEEDEDDDEDEEDKEEEETDNLSEEPVFAEDDPEEEAQPDEPEPEDRTPRAKDPEERKFRRDTGGKLAIKVLGAEGGEGVAEDILGSSGINATAPISGLEGNLDFGTGGSSEDGLALEGSGGGDGTGPGLKDAPKGKDGNALIAKATDKTPEKKERKKLKVEVEESDLHAPGASSSGAKSIQAVFSKKKRQISNCYKRFISKYGQKRGKITVKVSISSSGKVLKVSVPTNTIGDSFEKCVRQKIKRWDFGKQEKTITVAKQWVLGS